MTEPVLVILAAGMGSRFGGLKQMTSIDDYNHSIIDYSMYDAYRAGFKNVAFIIKHEIEEDFKERVGKRAEQHFHVDYIYQELDNLPNGYSVPEGRVKPWGTAHAVMCCRGIIHAPFAVINADDFYGRTAYEALYNFLTSDDSEQDYAMVAYLLKNTVTENGHVARGICCSKNGCLTDVVERTHIVKDGKDAKYTEDDGETWHALSGDSLVSMNCWAFKESMLDGLHNFFPAWLEDHADNALKAEYFLPYVVNLLIENGSARVHLLDCAETWYGITYKEDLQTVIDAVKEMHLKGYYPEKLLD